MVWTKISFITIYASKHRMNKRYNNLQLFLSNNIGNIFHLFRKPLSNYPFLLDNQIPCTVLQHPDLGFRSLWHTCRLRMAWYFYVPSPKSLNRFQTRPLAVSNQDNSRQAVFQSIDNVHWNHNLKNSNKINTYAIWKFRWVKKPTF